MNVAETNTTKGTFTKGYEPLRHGLKDLSTFNDDEEGKEKRIKHKI